ncbi:MAG: hypothetical protein L6R40_001831 [Gallowayella cf. fulva]|nr:MAG: hypothetical protein L6R40_001831 [Xanthomendoza cf. fulva]
MTLATLPYIRAVYNGFRDKIFQEREKQWVRQLQPRAGEDGEDADNGVQDQPGGHEQPAEDDEGGGLNFEIGVELEIIDEEEVPMGGDQPQELVDEAIANQLGHDHNQAQDGGEAPNAGALGQQVAANQNNNQNPNQGPPGEGAQNVPALAEQHRVIRLVPLVSAFVHTMIGALAFPAVAAGMGGLISLLLPWAWKTAPGRWDRRSPGFLQNRFGRSVVGGCLFLVLKDTLSLYTKYRLAQDHLHRRVLDHDSKRSKARAASKTKVYNATIRKLQSTVHQFSGKYAFLNRFQYTLGADQLTVFGEQEMINSGIAFYNRYDALAKRNTPFIRASGEERVVVSARNFSQGYHQAKTSDKKADTIYPYPILVISEGDGFNNTLNHDLCTAFEDGQPYSSIGSKAQQIFLATFLPAITTRLNSDLPGANLTATDTINLLDLCPFTTVASPIGTISPFCSLFTLDEWNHYDYYQSLGKYYGYGPGNPLGPTQGVGFVNELIARLTDQAVKDHTTVNQTLDSSNITFPLGEALYADFSHDNDMTSIFSALGLYNATAPLSNTSIQSTEATEGYSAAWTVPFAGRAYFERMKCAGEKEELVRILVNNRVVPLKTCRGDKLGRCSLSRYFPSRSSEVFCATPSFKNTAALSTSVFNPSIISSTTAMLSFKLLLAALMAGFVAAQNSTSGTSGSTDNTIFDVNNVDTTSRVQWCNDQYTNCPKLCGGPKFTKENRCIADPISYTCVCANGTSPDLAAYANTFVSDTCQARFAACRTQNPGSDACIQCGTLKADSVPMSTSSMSAASSTAAATSSGTGGGATGAAGPSQSNAAEPLIGGMEMVKGAVGIVAAMGLVL